MASLSQTLKQRWVSHDALSPKTACPGGDHCGMPAAAAKRNRCRSLTKLDSHFPHVVWNVFPILVKVDERARCCHLHLLSTRGQQHHLGQKRDCTGCSDCARSTRVHRQTHQHQ